MTLGCQAVLLRSGVQAPSPRAKSERARHSRESSCYPLASDSPTQRVQPQESPSFTIPVPGVPDPPQSYTAHEGEEKLPAPPPPPPRTSLEH